MWEKLKDNLKEKFTHWGSGIRDDDVMDLSQVDIPHAIENSECFKLYRYVPATYFNIRNIETQKIHLSPNGSMNDIYEGIPSSSNLSYYKLQKLNDIAMMTCMTESYNNTLMWSHYADSNAGMCIEYDLKLLKNASFNILDHLLPVVYTEKRIIKKDVDSWIESYFELKKAIAENYVYVGKENFDDILPLFLLKGKEWEYEKEWRIIYTRKQLYDIDEEELYGGNIKFECVSAVYLGYRIHPEIRKNIIEICQRISEQENKVSVFQAKLDNETYEIKFDALM